MLAYPGKVITDDAGSLWVADTGHHRVVGASAGGVVHTIIGSGHCGHADGSLATAALHSPQGLALSNANAALYVADAGAHVIRRVDLGSGQVRTIAGTGQPARAGEAGARGPWPARQVPLCAPWDVALDEEAGRLYVAMAGAHQIWVIDVAAPAGSETTAVLAGCGTRGQPVGDGTLTDASFARPCGLALSPDRRRLYVADSDCPAVRVVDLQPGACSPDDQPGRVTTLPGAKNIASAAPDRVSPEARLQRCLGVALTPSGLVVVDADALRGINSRHGTVTTLWPNRGELQLSQPGGVAFDRTTRTYVVADTHHHRLVRVARDASSAAEVRLAPAGAEHIH